MGLKELIKESVITITITEHNKGTAFEVEATKVSQQMLMGAALALIDTIHKETAIDKLEIMSDLTKLTLLRDLMMGDDS